MTDNVKREKMQRLRQEIDIAKGVMVETVEKLVKRAELIENIDEKTRDMRNQTQAFPLAGNELKIKLRKRHAAISGAIICGILGVSYGLINGHTKEGAAIGAVIAGVPASMLGGLVGNKLGEVSGVVERLWFRAVYTYRHFRPMQTLREKAYAWYYKDKMQSSVNDAQEMLEKYKKEESDSKNNNTNNTEKNPTEAPASSALLDSTQIMALGFESKKRQQKEEIQQHKQKVASTHLRARM